jgi:trk system potassium uptake protein TrkH
VFGAALIALGLAMAGPYLLALAQGRGEAGAYLFGGGLTVFFGAACVLLSSDRRLPKDLRSALLLVLLWWVIAPFFASIPLALAGAAFGDAYFESVSALTTTGAWLSNEAILANPPGLLWRAELQWMGGLASVAIAAAIFIRPAFIGIDTLLPPFSRGDRDSHLRPLRNAVTVFAGPYLLVTAAAVLSLLLAGLGAFEAFILGLSTVASGGIVPHEAGLSGYSSGVHLTLFPFILLSGANFVLIARALRGEARRTQDTETWSYLIIAFAVGAMFWVLLGAGDLSGIPAQIFNSASLLSTNGALLGEAPRLPAALITAIIGGAAVSTAGGFKIVRWLVIMRRAREEIRRLVTPHGVFGASRITNELGVWMHFLVFTMTLAGLVLAVTAGGHSLEIAVTTATSILSNTGPLLALAEGGEDGYAMFNWQLRTILVVGMILGRLEAVAALALINRAFWRF